MADILADIQEGKFYIASDMVTGKVLTIKGQSTTSGANLIIEPKNTTDKAHQLWTFNVDQKTFQSELTPQFVIAIAGGTLASGKPIVNERYEAGKIHQQWTAGSDHTIQPATNNDFVIGLGHQSTEFGTPSVPQPLLTTHSSEPAPDCMWHFEKV